VAQKLQKFTMVCLVVHPTLDSHYQ